MSLPASCSRFPRRLATLSGVAMWLVACESPDLIGGTQSRIERASAPLRIDDFAREEQELFELGREVPTYGGHRIAANGRVVVWLKDPKHAPKARSALRARISSGKYQTSGRALTGDVEVAQGAYEIGELAEWRTRILGEGRLPGLVYIDLDEGANRIRLGVLSSGAAASEQMLRERFTAIGIDSEALRFVPVLPPSDVRAPRMSGLASGLGNAPATLGSYTDTLVGGLRYVWRDIQRDSGWGCTVGFAAEMPNNQKGFLSAAHCSPRRFFNDVGNVTLHQPNGGTSIGFEQWDAPTQQCPWWWYYCTEYRYSDANINAVSGRSVRVGYIARPNTRFHQVGIDTTINQYQPYLRIDATTSFVSQGSTIDLIGATAGWRYGSVVTTCATVYLSVDGAVIKCAYETDIIVAEGDSGGPVFYFDGNNSVTAAGIVFRRTFPTSWFSKWNHVYDETTGSWPAPAWINVVANDVPLVPSVTIVGPGEMQPGNSCYWYASSNFQATDYEWKVNGSVVSTSSDLTHTAYSGFSLELNVSGSGMSASTSRSIVVSGGSEQCFVQ
jgi:hypothetical protein